SPPGAPTASDDVCIGVNGSYTVGVSDSAAVARSVTVAATGGPILLLQANCSFNARLTVGGAVTLGPDDSISLSSVTCGNTATLDAGTNTITSPKAITSFAGAGGGRQIVGNVVSGGAIT